MIRKRVFISGKVQGVYYRAFTEKAAKDYGITGWVRNMNDGRVEAVIEGRPEAVDKMLKWFWTGSPSSRVESVEVFDEDCAGEFKSFSIKY